MLAFTARTIVQHAQPNQRLTVKQDGYYCHAHVRLHTGLAGVAVTDADYPPLAAFSVIRKVIEQFKVQNSSSSKAVSTCWQTLEADDLTAADEILRTALPKYQDPAEADNLVKIQQDLEETRGLILQVVDKLLIRGDQLDELVAKSADLSMAGKVFLKQARRTNSCCKLM
jgi:synaptobrevin family protein YKT6